MSYSKSIQNAQVPIGCQLCESGSRIQWRCEECNLLICNPCKTVHLKLAKDHKINDIKSGLKDCQICEVVTGLKWKCEDCQLFLCDSCRKIHSKKSATKDHKIVHTEIDEKKKSERVDEAEPGNQNNVEFKLRKRYTVKTRNIHYMVASVDGSLWIGSNDPNELIHAMLSGDTAITLSYFGTKVFGLAGTSTGSPFIVVGGSTLMLYSDKTNHVGMTKFNIHPWVITCAHVTRDQNVIVGGRGSYGHGVVIVMDQSGRHLIKYERDQNKSLIKQIKNPLFKSPRNIVTTSNSNILISDQRGKDWRGRIVVVKPDEGCIQYYKGHNDINSKDKQFNPFSITVTPSDRVVVLDNNTDYIHILSYKGDFIAYCNLKLLGVAGPSCLALSPSGKIYIGNESRKRDLEEHSATLYELQYFGI